MFLYKYQRSSVAPDFQITFAWFHLLWQNRITLSGFMDFWTQDDYMNNPEDKILVIYGEPQIWYNISQKIAIGSEFKLNYNFYPGSERFEVFPTVGLKYEF